MIMDGEVDEYPEAAFNLVGTIEEAIEKGDSAIMLEYAYRAISTWMIWN